jgi:hypothetical protein
MLAGFDPETIQDLEGARTAIRALLNLVEELQAENQALRKEVAELRDEVNRLKGEQGRPQIKPDKKKGQGTDHSSEEERRRPKSWRKGPKNDQIRIDREERLSVDKGQMPADVEFKGYVESIVQDLRIRTDNVLFVKEKYHSPSERQVYVAPLPAGYDGQFGPGIRSLVVTLYYAGGMTESKILEFLTQFGISISTGQVSNLLVKDQERWHAEKDAVWRAGLESSDWQHMDDTATRVDGENQHCHVLCNPYYTAYFTRPGKDRVTLIHLLQGTETVQLRLNQETFGWLDLFQTPLWAQRRLGEWPQNQLLAPDQFVNWVESELAARLNDQQRARIVEAAALTAYHAQTEIPVIPILLTDDAPQFGHIARQQALCWIHEGRHYKKLTPFVPHHQKLLADFLDKFWAYYRQLQDYREAPTPSMADQLRERFHALFSTQTGYDQLDKRIAKTLAKKKHLLLVLDYPHLLLHNNPAELGVRQRVRKRDISFGPRSADGVAAWDTFMTLTETAKKLGVSFYAYVFDRISMAYRLSSLAELIAVHAQDSVKNPVPI